MTSDPLLGAHLKIERAKKHINDFITEMNAFRAKNTYRVVADKHPRSGDITYRASVTEEIPVSWSTYIGDFVHNLRAALDVLACTLISANGAQVRRRHGFPIAETRKRFEADAAGKIDGASDAAKRFIHRLKPYKTGNSALWQIHELDILDKHKAIVPVGLAYRHFTMTTRMKVPWQNEPVTTPGISIRPADRRYPLKDGHILLRVKSAALSAEHETDYQFAFEVAFGEGQVVDGQPLIPTLQQYGQMVERIISIAQQRFF